MNVAPLMRTVFDRPIRAGARIKYDDVRHLRRAAIAGALMLILFGTMAVASSFDPNNGFLADILLWVFVSLALYSLVVVAAALYGYRHRDQIDPGDAPVANFNAVYLGAAFAAGAGPVVDLIIKALS